MKATLRLLPMICQLNLFFSVPVYSESLDTRNTLMARNSPISTVTLKNSTYNLPDIGEVTLKNGVYQSNTGLEVTMGNQPVISDLNGDGSEDAAVILTVNSEEAPPASYLAAVVITDGNYNNVDTLFLGNQVQIESVTVEGDNIRVTMFPFNPDFPDNPEKITLSYQLISNQLVAQSFNQQQRNPNDPVIQNVPNSTVGEDNQPSQPPTDEIQIKF